MSSFTGRGQLLVSLPMLLPIAPALDFFDCGFRPDLGVLVGRWLRPISTEESKQGYAHFLVVARQHGCRLWLMDVRRRPRMDNATLTWLFSDYFPAAARDLGGPIYLSTLLAPGLLQELVGHVALPSADAGPAQPCHLGRFITEHEALAWLYQRPAATPGG